MGKDIGKCSRPQTFKLMDSEALIKDTGNSPILLSPLSFNTNSESRLVGPPQLASQRDKKRESSCWTMLPSKNKVENDGTEYLFFG